MYIIHFHKISDSAYFAYLIREIFLVIRLDELLIGRPIMIGNQIEPKMIWPTGKTCLSIGALFWLGSRLPSFRTISRLLRYSLSVGSVKIYLACQRRCFNSQRKGLVNELEIFDDLIPNILNLSASIFNCVEH